MDQTTNLSLPFIMPSQAQKQVTHNQALQILDGVVQLSVLDRDLTTPPASPADGARYIPASGSTGAWAGKDNAIAAWQNGAWSFFTPLAGWRSWVSDEAALLFWNGTAWAKLETSFDSLQNLAELGVGTTADSTNPFSARLNTALWTAKYAADGGSGDLRYTMNKEGSSNTASLLMQTNWSGRAEVGLAGDDNFHFKVSPDGSAWTDAIVIDKTSGDASVVGLTHAASAKPLAGLVFTPGGDGQVSIYRIDIARTQNPRTATLSSVSDDVLTLSSAVAGQFFSTLMAGVSLLRIWNTTKSPAQSAWIKALPGGSGGSALQVLDATAIVGWSAGDTVRLGDGASNGNGVAIDMSPMLLAMTGAVFPQRGVVLRALVEATGGADQAQVAVSATAATGSYVALESSPNGTLHNGTMICPTSVLSPVSNSNLLFFRETNVTSATDATLGRIGVSVLGVFA